MMNMKIKRKLAMMLSILMLAASAAPLSLAEGAATPSESSQEPEALVQLITPEKKAEETPTPTPTSAPTPTPKIVAAPGAILSSSEDAVTAEITGEAGLAIYADLSGDTRLDLSAGDVVTFTGLAAGSYDFEVDYHELQAGVSAFRTSVSVAGKPVAAETTAAAEETTPPPVNSVMPLADDEEDDKIVAAPGAAWTVSGDSVSITVSGEAGLRMYVDATLGWDDEVYAGETVMFTGAEAGKSYDLEVDYYDVQEGVSAYRTSIEIPAAAGGTQTAPPADTQTTPPAGGGTEAITPPPTEDSQTTPPASAETTPPAEQITPPPSGGQSTAPTQFDVAVFQQDGVISAQVSGACDWEVALTLLLNGTVVESQAVIGNGSVAFAKQSDGTYTVRAAYVTPTDGINPVEKTVEIKNTGSSGSASAEKKPTVIQLGASVVSGDNWIEVKVTDADGWPLYVAVGNDYKTVSVGETARFDGLSAGEYGVEVDYVDPVSGVSPFRSSVSITKAPAGTILFTAVGGENRIEVTVTDASALPIAVALVKDGMQIAEKTIPGGVGKQVFDGLAAGTYSVIVDYDPAQDGISAKEQSGVVVTDPAPAPAIKEIVFSATGGVERIDVSVTDASTLPVTVTVKKDGVQVAAKTIAAGVGKESFTGLAAGTYTVVVNYDPAQSGVSAKEQTGVVVAGKAVGITITSVKPGENVMTVTGTAQPGADIALTTIPAASAAAIVRADAKGAFTANIVLAAGTYTQVQAVYVADNTVSAVASGTYVVAAPATKPTLSVDPVSSKTQQVIAMTTPGVTVNLRVKAYNYGQTVVADSRGLLKYSLPQAYPKGTVITFTVYYGTNNAQSYQQTVTIGSGKTYPLLKYGDTGDAVEELTDRLEDLGYLDDDSRRYSSAVREAVKLFQQLNGLDVDGIAGQETQSVLFSVGAIPYGASGVYPTLARGDKGLAAIYKLQRRLKDLGYYTIAVDGVFGSGTERAVRHFQRINGLPKTGVADNATQKLLYSSSAKAADSVYADDYKVLSRSSSYHSAVVPLQRRLKALGYAVGSADGYFGSRTQRAVREFQRRNGLSVTGVADEAMQRLLFSSSAKAASGSSSSSSSSSSASTGYRLLYWGCKGDDVKRLQNALLSAGYKEVRVADGVYGEWTYDAVRAYQKDHGLDVDGVAGKKTQNALYGTSY